MHAYRYEELGGFFRFMAEGGKFFFFLSEVGFSIRLSLWGGWVHEICGVWIYIFPFIFIFYTGGVGVRGGGVCLLVRVGWK